MTQSMHHSGTAGLQPASARPVLKGMDVLRPFLLLACVAFTVGFVGYWALVGVLTPSQEPAWALAPADAAPAQVAAPVEPALTRAHHI